MMTIVSNLKEAAGFIPPLRPHARHTVLKHLIYTFILKMLIPLKF